MDNYLVKDLVAISCVTSFAFSLSCQMPVSASMGVVSKIPFLSMTDLILLLDLVFNIKFYVACFIIKRRVEAQRYTKNPCAPL